MKKNTFNQRFYQYSKIYERMTGNKKFTESLYDMLDRQKQSSEMFLDFYEKLNPSLTDANSLDSPTIDVNSSGFHFNKSSFHFFQPSDRDVEPEPVEPSAEVVEVEPEVESVFQDDVSVDDEPSFYVNPVVFSIDDLPVIRYGRRFKYVGDRVIMNDQLCGWVSGHSRKDYWVRGHYRKL